MDDAEHERAFNPTEHQEEELVRRNELSAALRARTTHRVVAYGPGERECLDIYRPERPNGAVALFFHGGYWRMGNRASHAFVAGPLIDAGVTAILAGYDLCPAVRLETIVDQARAARDAVLERADELGLDVQRFLVMGSSAGAQLSAMLLLDGPAAWPAPPSAALISGLFDLEPVLRTSVNRDLRLSARDIEMFSPVRRNERFYARQVLVAVGADESESWRRGVAALAERVARDAPVQELVLTGRNHFSITTGLAFANDPLTVAALDLISGPAPDA